MYIAPYICICKIRSIGMKETVPSARREFKTMEIPPATFKMGSTLQKL
jgi:hypothetical protein